MGVLLGFGGALYRAEVYSTDSAGKRLRRRHAKLDPGCTSCGLGEWSCRARVAGCCGDCWHPPELESRETHSYYSGGEHVEHADGLAFAIAALSEGVRRAWAMRYAGVEWEWCQHEVNDPAEIRRLLERDWYQVATNIVQAQFRVFAGFEQIGRELGIATSTAHAWVRQADQAIAKAWL